MIVIRQPCGWLSEFILTFMFTITGTKFGKSVFELEGVQNVNNITIVFIKIHESLQ